MAENMSENMTGNMSENTCCDNCPETCQRNIVDIATPLFYACGAILYRMHVTAKAEYVYMDDGSSVGTRIANLEKAAATNTSTRFAEDIARRNALTGLIAGDMCYVANAAADPEVKKGPAMYMYLNGKWVLLYKRDSPLNPANFIKQNGGLDVDEGGLLFVDFSKMPAADKAELIKDLINTGSGLKVNADGKLDVDPEALAGFGLEVDEKKLKVKASDLAGSGLQVGVNGKLNVNFAEMPDDQMKQSVLRMIKTGGGLSVGEDGRIFFDADSMDTAVFDKMLKALRLPKWLTAHTNFYVDKSHAAAADTLDEGRGLSADKPFKTIQACVNHVCTDYNFGRYSAIINVAPGVYDPFQVSGYTSAGGTLTIQGKDIGTGEKPVIKGLNDTCARIAKNLVYLLWLKLEEITSRTAASGIATHRCIIAEDRATVFCGGIDFSLTHAESTGASANNDHVIHSTNYASIVLGLPGKTEDFYQNSITFDKGSYGNINVLYSSGKATIYLSGSRYSNTNATCPVQGTCSAFCTVDSGASCSLYGAYNPQFNFSIPTGQTVTGKRYAVTSSGNIDIRGAGAEFFPGSTAGTVEEETFAWYK